MRPDLIAVHRLLILMFIALAMLFGWIMLRRYVAAGETAGLAGAIVSGVVAAAGAVYLTKARHLRRK